MYEVSEAAAAKIAELEQKKLEMPTGMPGSAGFVAALVLDLELRVVKLTDQVEHLLVEAKTEEDPA